MGYILLSFIELVYGGNDGVLVSALGFIGIG